MLYKKSSYNLDAIRQKCHSRLIDALHISSHPEAQQGIPRRCLSGRPPQKCQTLGSVLHRDNPCNKLRPVQLRLPWRSERNCRPQMTEFRMHPLPVFSECRLSHRAETQWPAFLRHRYMQSAFYPTAQIPQKSKKRNKMQRGSFSFFNYPPYTHPGGSLLALFQPVSRPLMGIILTYHAVRSDRFAPHILCATAHMHARASPPQS